MRQTKLVLTDEDRTLSGEICAKGTRQVREVKSYLGTDHVFFLPPMKGTPSVVALRLASADAFLSASRMRASSAFGCATPFVRVR